MTGQTANVPGFVLERIAAKLAAHEPASDPANADAYADGWTEGAGFVLDMLQLHLPEPATTSRDA